MTTTEVYALQMPLHQNLSSSESNYIDNHLHMFKKLSVVLTGKVGLGQRYKGNEIVLWIRGRDARLCWYRQGYAKELLWDYHE